MHRRDFNFGLLGLLAAGLSPASTALAVSKSRTDDRERLEIPSNTWIARPLPGWGKAPVSGKDFRMVFNPLDQEFYVGFGDWGGPDAMNSGRQELYSYHVGKDQWSLVQPYCLGEGQIQPSGPDELGWVFDSKREIFWMIPGFQWKTDCPSAIKGKVMTFDPRTRKWSIVEEIERIGSDVVYSQYDPKEDTILSFAWDGGRGCAIDIIDCSSRTKDRVFFGRGVSNARVSKNYTAMDLASRTIYAVDTQHGDFYAYDMDRRTLSRVGESPYKPGKRNQAIMTWDSRHNVLLWPVKDVVYVYDPRGGWSRSTPPAPDGVSVFGQSVGYDPHHDALIYMGGYAKRNPNLFLYRYEPE